MCACVRVFQTAAAFVKYLGSNRENMTTSVARSDDVIYRVGYFRVLTYSGDTRTYPPTTTNTSRVENVILAIGHRDRMTCEYNCYHGEDVFTGPSTPVLRERCLANLYDWRGELVERSLVDTQAIKQDRI